MDATLMKPRRGSTLRRVRVPYTGRKSEKQGSAVPRRRLEIDSGARDLPSRFARHLLDLMEKNGWSSKDVSQRLSRAGLEIGPRGVDVWLRAEGSPKFRDLETIGRALGLKDYRDVLPPPK